MRDRVGQDPPDTASGAGTWTLVHGVQGHLRAQGCPEHSRRPLLCPCLVISSTTDWLLAC